MQTDPALSAGRVRFGDFEVDAQSHELLRLGSRVPLQEKSFLVLNELLKSPGRVVTREELAAALWPKEHFVDAEHGLNTAVRRLREALGDSADDARFIETLPKRGYRFIGAIEGAGESPPLSSAPVRTFRRGTLAAAILVALALAAVATLVARSRSARTPSRTAESVNELLARSRYLRNNKRFAEAKTFAEEALKLDPKNAHALGALAIGLVGEGKEDQARETARRALELDPKALEAHRALGVLERGAGNFAAAERHFRRAAEADPSDFKSRNRLARHLLECGRLDEAKELIVETRRLAPDDLDVQNIWMEYALRTGDYESAIRQGEIWISIWAKQITGQPTPAVRDMLGLAYVGARRHEDALVQFRAIDPGDDLRVALALGYAGRTAEARTILDAHERTDAAASAVADPGLAGAMAMAYVALGDFDRAFEHLDRQVAARWFPVWLNCKMFHPIRRDPRWAVFARRLEIEFLGREKGGTSPPGGSGVVQILQGWPRPAKGSAVRVGP